MIRFVIIAHLLAISSLSAGKIKKCCPLGLIIQEDSVEDHNLSPKKHFSCVPESPINIKNGKDFMFDISINSTNLSELIGYNVLINKHSNLPLCSDGNSLSSTIINGTVKDNPIDSCVDLMDGNYQIFSCDDKVNGASEMVDIYKLKKCCAIGQAYDIFARRCVNNNESNLNDDFREFLHDKIVTFESGLPKCEVHDVLVEYHSHVHKLKMYESSLIITAIAGTGPAVIMPKSYCIDSTINSEIEVPEGADHKHFQLKRTSKWIAKVCRIQSICDSMPCIRKCCGEGLRITVDNITHCEPHEQDLSMKFHYFNIDRAPRTPSAIEPSEYGIITADCEKFIFSQDEKLHYYSGIDGSLFIPQDEKFHTYEEYCVDYLYDKFYFDPDIDEIKLVTFICFGETTYIRFKFYATMLAISSAFLLFTFIVYIFLPKLLNLHGKIVTCHVLSLLLAYSFLSAVQFQTEVKLQYCICIAFIIYFSFLSAFSWLNVMCLDIFLTFGSMRMTHGMRRSKEVKRFIYYSLYAWGFPFLMTILTFLADMYAVIPKEIKPDIGKSSCWFDKNSSPGHLIFFLIPVGIQISINIFLFLLTAIHCNRVKAEIHRMQLNDSNEQKKRRFIADKAIFMMNLKLFIVMGVSWLLEIFASLFNEHSIWWSIADFFNLMQGVLVFFIFVFKRNVLVAFQKKLGIRTLGMRPKVIGSTATNTSTLELNSTSVSKYSSGGKALKSSGSSSTLTNLRSNIKN